MNVFSSAGGSKMKIELRHVTVRELTEGYVDDGDGGVR